MTEVPPPQEPLDTRQEPLETRVATPSQKMEQPEEEKPLTLVDLIGGLARGLLPLVLGTAGGYWATGGPGGIGASLLLTSLGAGLITDNEKDTNSQKIADLCYKLGMVVGAVTGIAATYVWYQRTQGK